MEDDNCDFSNNSYSYTNSYTLDEDYEKDVPEDANYKLIPMNVKYFLLDEAKCYDGNDDDDQYSKDSDLENNFIDYSHTIYD